VQAISILHQAARAYAEAGIPVFPCEVGGKRPVTVNGFKDATTDLNQIDIWWSEADYNLAFSPGDANIFVVDIDPGADLSLLEKFPLTYTARTPRGGYHLYFEGSGRTSASKLAPYVDTRGIGGYVLVAPSAVDGKYLRKNPSDPYEDGVLYPYQVQKPFTYAELPQWIPEALSVADTHVAASVEDMDLPENIERAKKRLQQLVAADDVAIEGCGGDDRTYRLCCEMLDLGLSVPTAQELIEDIWNPKCLPPWDSYEIEQKLINASHYQQNEAGAYAVGTSEQAFGGAVAALMAENKLEVKRSRFHFKDEAEVDEEPDPTWLVKELISERSTVMMFGPSGSYKSFIALLISLGIAAGTKTFGGETKKGLVFYGALEGKAHLKKARRAWKILHGVDSVENFFVGNAPMIGVPGEMQEFGDEIAKRCAGRKPTLIVIDTLSKAMAGLNENDAADAGKFIQFCDSLVEHFGCTVLAIHHTGKDGERGARGSSAFFAGFDTVLEVKAHKATKAVSVYVRKHKDAEEREIPWTFEGRLTGPSLTFSETTLEQHRLLVGETKDITPKSVGAALRDLNAFGDEAGVTTAVLATQLTEAREDESVEDRSAAIARTGRALSAASHKSLEAYAVKRGKATVWCLPAPVKS
jgi:hypothetical protein